MIDEISKKIQEIKNDRRSGAFALTMRAAEIFKLYADGLHSTNFQTLITDINQISQAICDGQPDMAPLISLCESIKKATDTQKLKSQEPYKMAIAISIAAKEFEKRLKESKNRICYGLFNLIKERDTIITNSYSSTLYEALIRTHQMGKPFHVIVPESRPGFEGRELAKALGRSGVPCTLIVDAASLLQLESSSFAIVGADSVTEKFVINKIGTLSLALGAKHLAKDFFVIADSSKFIPSSKSRGILKKHPAEEVLKEKYPNVAVSNPYFEKTPLSLVSGFLTEAGIVSPEQARASIIT